MAKEIKRGESFAIEQVSAEACLLTFTICGSNTKNDVSELHLLLYICISIAFSSCILMLLWEDQAWWLVIIPDWSVLTVQASLYSNSHLDLAGISLVAFVQYIVRYAVFFLGRLGIQASIQYLNTFEILREQRHGIDQGNKLEHCGTAWSHSKAKQTIKQSRY